MKITSKSLHLARAALLATAAFSTLPASADTVLTAYASGDLFIGFRQAGVANTLVVNLGSATKFLPSNLGGTWNGTPFNVTFGIVPGSATVVTNLNADLVSNFGVDWAANFNNGTGVRWGVVGFTTNLENNVPIPGYNARTAFITQPRLNPAVQSTLGSVNNATFAGDFNSFANGLGGGSFINQNSTENSSVAYIGAASDPNNWGTRAGANGAFGLGANRSIEQLGTGVNQGTTDSVLDLWVAPSSGSTITTARTFAGGSFTLSADGVLTYGVVPEPGSAALLGAGALGLGLIRRRKKNDANH
jgi:PEP-CTERM motif